MGMLSDADRARVRDAIRAAEARTSGEFVTVIAARATHYLEFALLYALLVGVLVAATEPWWGGWGRPTALLGAALAEAVVAIVLIALPKLRVALVPTAIRRARCQALAREQFVVRDVARTQARTGVLLFVASDERYVEVIADAGIHAKVPAGFWQQVVDQFTAAVREGRVGDGFVAATESIGAALAQHFPRAVDDANELPDHLIEL